jgi:hypothetical protein
MRDPFKIDDQTCISFSGGRTSAYMLWRVLQAHDMMLPPDAVVCFANTGKEDEATLRFVQQCSERWGVHITWLEFQQEAPGYRVVTYENASRQGEPFEALIKKKNYLPNPVTRFCTIELKIRPIAKYLVDIGFADTKSEGENMSMVGIRADEPRRAAKIADRGRIPLVTVGVTKEIVGQFWASQPFDLELPNIGGVTYHGNCDLCFLKGGSQIMSLIAEQPERAVWWARMESTVLASKPLGARFRSDLPSYAEMLKFSQEQHDMF